MSLLTLGGCGGGESFNRFVDDYWASYFAANPTAATYNGIHDYDSRLEDLSSEAITRRRSELEAFATRLAALTPPDPIDAAILASQIQAELYEIRDVQGWRHNPMGYVGTPGGAIDTLMKRSFAPPKERLTKVIGRLEGVPPMMAAMKANVDNPPREFTDLSIRMAKGSVGFFKETVAGWAKEAAAGDAALLARFTKVNDAAAAAVADAASWLEKDLLPRSKGRYAIGAEAFSKKLLYEEMIDQPLEEILRRGEANLEKDYQAFLATAQEIDPKKSPAEVMASLANDHPTEADLIPSTRRTLEGIRQFLVDKQIIDLPSTVLPHVEETPPYARSGSFASMDTPGAYEVKADEAFYYVTPPEKDWDARHKEEHLRLYNKPVLDIITIHEAYPGHYTQFLFAKQFPTKTRKLYMCSSNAEGWAHYAEQMMLEEGFGAGDARIRLAQLSEALLRDVRYVVGIKLHTQGMTVEDGAKMFVEKAFQEPANGYEEARRGAYNPTYLYYTLGKLEIYKLRDEYKQKKGAGYTLKQFHTDFVRQGAIPISLIRRILLGA